MAASCPKNAQFLDLSEFKNDIVNSHNEKRNQVAGGKIAKHQSAVRMATIQWDDELAYLAGLNVKTCNYGHDQCRNTDTFGFAGQNIAKKWWYGKNPEIKTLLLEQINNWFGEFKDSDMSKINKVARSSSGPATGHFTVMVAELSIRVGCAAVRSSEFKNGYNMETLTTACNYAHTNVIDHRIYRAGAAASQCKTGKNPQYPFLCSVKESYDPNTPLK